MFDLQSNAPRDKAQELVWEAMDQVGVDNDRAEALCHEALSVYPDCVDAIVLLAQTKQLTVRDYVARLREAVDAGRRDLGPDCFQHERGYFWGLIETRPFMRALANLADALIEWGTHECVEDAAAIYEEMLELNPNDNQGVRDPLGAAYLELKRYDQARQLFERYESTDFAVPLWSKLILLHATGEEGRAQERLQAAREQNPHAELYFTGKKRRPRNRVSFYSPGDGNEAVYCADMLWGALKKHPKTKQWIKAQCA